MNKNQLIALFNKELRKEAHIQGFKKESTEHVVRHISQFGERGFVGSSNVNENNAREIIRKELNYFRSLKQPFEWKVYSNDKPENLKDILKDEGFTIGDPEALMVMEINNQHPLLSKGPFTDVKEITDEQGIKEIIALEEGIWNRSLKELGERLWRDKQNNQDTLYLYGIYENKLLVSAAWMYLEKNSSFASLWGGSTLPMYRGKGHYSKLLAIRARKAFEKGRPYLTVDASPMSRPILEKYGFHCLAYSYECESPEFE